jgi:arabinofuranan 3-O-arabinosyltransferase
LAVTENFNAGWTATLNGKTLRPVRLDGWRQAWIVPAGTAGDVALSFGPARLYHGLLVGGFALLFGIAWVAVRRSRALPRIEPAEPVSRGPSPFPMMFPYAAVCVLGLLLAGAVGGCIAIALIVATYRSTVLPGLAALSFASAGLIAALRTTTMASDGIGAFGAPAQALAVVAVLALALTLLRDHEAST